MVKHHWSENDQWPAAILDSVRYTITTSINPHVYQAWVALMMMLKATTVLIHARYGEVSMAVQDTIRGNYWQHVLRYTGGLKPEHMVIQVRVGISKDLHVELQSRL